MRAWPLLPILLLAGCTLVRDLDDLDAEVNTPPPTTTNRVPPPPPEGASSGDGEGYAYAITKLYLGDTLRDGTEDVLAFEEFGYDIDGHITSRLSTDVCRYHPDEDGPVWDSDDGVDNSFGHSLVFTLFTLADYGTEGVHQAIASGQYTILIWIQDLGFQANYLNLRTLTFQGTSRVDGSPPTWSATSDSVSQDTLSSSNWQFESSYVNNHTFVTAPTNEFRMVLLLPGSQMVLQLRHAVLTMELSEDRMTATNGVISGLIPVEDLVAAVRDKTSREVAGPSSCSWVSGAELDARQAVDILVSGNQDPDKDCDAVSVGLGFEAERVTIAPTVVPLEHELIDDCP